MTGLRSVPRRLRRAATVAVVGVAIATASGCGDHHATPPGGLGAGVRLELITMSDSAFTPDHFTAQVGEKVTFRFVNVGALRHEAVLGDEARQEAHAEAMREFTATSVPGGAGRTRTGVGHRSMRAHPGMTDPLAVLVEPGSSGEITFTFDRPGRLILGCHEPGHWEAGMRATIDVVA